MKRVFSPANSILVAMFAGVIGALLRVWLYMEAVDGSGLLVRGTLPELLTWVFMALTMLVLLLIAFQAPEKIRYEKVFTPFPLGAAGCVFAGAGIVVATLFSPASTKDILGYITLGMSGVAVICLCVLAWFRAKGKRPPAALYAVVTVYFMLFLISQYRYWSAEPQMQNYLFLLLALVFLMVGTYQRGALAAHSGSFRAYIFFTRGALFFCCVGLYSATPETYLLYLTMALWLMTDTGSALKNGKMPLPKTAAKCVKLLEGDGFYAYAVGGCTRDYLLSRKPHDYDLCTNATPQQMHSVFSQYELVTSGEKHGTVGVIVDGEVVEITTFRVEGGYEDNRHPEYVEFVSDVEDDLSRRDFTVNAIAYRPGEGFLDPFGGVEDLKNRVLRTVGSPEKRFSEDALRILRGVRLAVQYRLKPEAGTLNAMLTMAPRINSLAKERVYDELCKLLPVLTAQDMTTYAPILTQVLPELAPCVDFRQNSPHHAYDVYTHTAHVVESAPATLTLRWAALLHDCGKPACYSEDVNGRGHFYGHAAESARLAGEILTRLKAPTAVRERVVFLVAHHMDTWAAEKKLVRRRLSAYGVDATRELLALQKADFSSKGTGTDSQVDFNILEYLVNEILQEKACLTIKDLDITGDDLIEIGFPQGKEIGDCLQYLLDQVLDDALPNDRAVLVDRAARWQSEQ